MLFIACDCPDKGINQRSKPAFSLLDCSDPVSDPSQGQLEERKGGLGWLSSVSLTLTLRFTWRLMSKRFTSVCHAWKPPPTSRLSGQVLLNIHARVQAFPGCLKAFPDHLGWSRIPPQPSNVIPICICSWLLSEILTPGMHVISVTSRGESQLDGDEDFFWFVLHCPPNAWNLAST